jgi:hypothetical protein
MEEPAHKISSIELKRLLIDLKEKRPDISVRFRLIGELWYKNFMLIDTITEKGATLKDETEGKIISIQNLNNVMQFELETQFQNFHPHYHYSVIASVELL